MRLRPRLGVLLLAAALAAGCSAVRVGPAERSAAVTGRGLDVTDYAIHLDLHPLDGALDGEVVVTLRALQELDRVILDAVDLEVRGVGRLRGAGPDAAPIPGYRHDGRFLEIPLDPPLPAGRSVRLRIAWRAEPAFGMYFVRPSDKGFQFPAQVFTQGECLGTRYWLPCNDHPADRASYSLTATVPAGWITVSGGSLRGREKDPGGASVTDSWVMEAPLPTYLITFAAGPFVTSEDVWDGIPVQYVLEPADLQRGRAALADTPEVLDFLSEYTGFRYPFPKYATVAVRDFPFGGMENASATTITRGALPPASQAAARPAWGLVAHEAAHQWFGDTVTCADWPHVWLNEGFASYFGQLYARHRLGEEAFRLRMGRSVDGYLAACRGPDLRALVEYRYEHPFDLFFSGGAAYGGGASRLNLLRGWIGEDLFRRVIRTWLEDHAFTSVTTADFEETVARVTGEDFSAFFEQWVESPGYPELALTWQDDASGRLRVTVRQVQATAGGVPEVFRMPLDLRWADSAGWHEERVWIRQREAAFEFEAGFPVRLVEFDPEVYLPARWKVDEPVSATLARLAEGKSARSRYLALRALARVPGEAVQGALWQTAGADPLPGLRAAAAGVLAGRLAAGGVARAAEAWRGETDPEARGAWLRLLADRAGEGPAAAILERVLADADGDPGWRATALRGLAAVQPPEALRGFLETRIEESLPEGGPLYQAAVDELARRLPDGDTRARLVDLAGRGHTTPVRTAALAHLGRWVAEAQADSDPTVVAVRKALLSPSVPLRRAAARVAGSSPRWFEAERARLLRTEADRAVRRALERP